ncbi:hypothetical protein [Streptomyces sp. NBC_00986]|nr:hypothetical protein OG504_20165 [Streptomyces sp. NBC_00986]
MTEPAAVGYLGIAAMVAAACAVVFLVAAVASAVLDKYAPPIEKEAQR